MAQQAALIAVPGTKCSLVPPTGFVPATNFAGFQHSALGASIMITEITAPYEALVKSFTKEALAAKGMTLIKNETVDFKQGKATLVQVTQEAAGATYKKLMLLFKQNDQTVMVNGIFPVASDAIEADMKTALFSTVYNAAQDDDPLAAASFIINTAGTDFEATKFISGSLMYTTDGMIPTQRPIFMVAPSLQNIPAASQRQYAEQRLRKLPGAENAVIKQTTAISIDGLNGYEIIADSKTKEGKAQLTYQVMIYDSQGAYFVIVGQAAEETGKYLQQFQQLAKTFKRK